MANSEDGSVRTIHQPIHATMYSRLDPQYIAFHEKNFQYVPTIESTPWDPECRVAAAASTLGRAQPVSVGNIRDLRVKSDNGLGNEGMIEMRIFTPDEVRPVGGWPVMIWMHGGQCDG